jgi:hypothetical protein
MGEGLAEFAHLGARLDQGQANQQDGDAVYQRGEDLRNGRCCSVSVLRHRVTQAPLKQDVETGLLLLAASGASSTAQPTLRIILGGVKEKRKTITPPSRMVPRHLPYASSKHWDLVLPAASQPGCAPRCKGTYCQALTAPAEGCFAECSYEATETPQQLGSHRTHEVAADVGLHWREEHERDAGDGQHARAHHQIDERHSDLLNLDERRDAGPAGSRRGGEGMGHAYNLEAVGAAERRSVRLAGPATARGPTR